MSNEYNGACLEVNGSENDQQQRELHKAPDENEEEDEEQVKPNRHGIKPTVDVDAENGHAISYVTGGAKNNFFAETKQIPPTMSLLYKEVEPGENDPTVDQEVVPGENEHTGLTNKDVDPNDPTSSIDEVVEFAENDDIDDCYPRARDFLAHTGNGGFILANQATQILEGFHNEDENGHKSDDVKTVATHRRSVTRVHLTSSTFRSAMVQKEEAEQKARHPHQSIFDILDRNFEELGDGSSRGGRNVGHKDVKLCFVAFVAVFSVPREPAFAIGDFNDINSHEKDPENGNNQISEANGEESFSRQHTLSPKECVLQRVPLSVAFAMWNEVLRQSHGRSKEENSNDHLSYIRSTLVLLGMLDLASIERDRGDRVAASNGQCFDYSKRTIECLVVHDSIHQQYGEYLAWGDHEGAYRSIIEVDGQLWNEGAMNESKQIGSNHYTMRMHPLNTIRANHMQDAFDLLNDKTFVRRRIRVLGALGAAKAHVGDVNELLCFIERQMQKGDLKAEMIDQQAGLLGAYNQVLKYCLHETEELTKPHKDEEGSIRLGKTAMYRIAEIGDALHLLGTSLGGYGFFYEEMEYYKEALRLKKLSVNGEIEKSVSASDTLHSMGFSLDNAGKNDEALECYDQALGIRYSCLGDDDLRIAETQHNKGALLCEEDRAEEAMECLEEALRIRETHYGEEHESCADTMQWMGNLLRKHGDPSNALEYFKFALSIKQKRLGSDDIDVGNTLFNTAVLLDDIEKYELSLVAYEEALRIRKLVLGENNQDVADTLFCMGNVATLIENHEDALGYYAESIRIREALIQADDHAKGAEDTLLFISNPSLPNHNLLLHYEKLSQCFEEALPLTKLIKGTNHPFVCDLLNRMGDVYKKLHDWDNAIGSFQGALRAKREDSTAGRDDAVVASLLQKKGEAHLYKNEFIRAKATFDSVMQLNRTLSGADSMSVASSAYCLGVAYHYLNDFSHAKVLFQECMRIWVNHASENDTRVIRSLCWIGRQYEKLVEPEKALEQYLSALHIYKKEKTSIDYRVVVMLLHAIGGLYEDSQVNLEEMALKCYNEEISLIRSKLDVEEMQITRILANAHFKPGMLCKRRGDTEKSIEYLKTALDLTKQCDGEKSVNVATISDSLGMLYASCKEFSQAKKYYSLAYSVYEKTVGREELTTSDCAFRLGKVLEALESTLALDFYEESLRVHKLKMDEDDKRLGEILFCSGRVYLKKEAYQDAVKYLEEALGIRKRLLGDSSDLADTYQNLGKTYYEMEQHEKALIFYRESVRINKKTGEKGALYRVSLDMALCATSCSHFQLAIDCYDDCLQAIESLHDKGKDTAFVLQQMGEIQMNKLQNYGDATTLLLGALEILRGEVAEEGEGSDTARNIISSVLLISQAYALAKDYENSIHYYEEHIKLLGANTPEDEDALANSLYEMGNIFAAMDKDPNYASAIEKLSDCLDIKRKIFGSDDEQVVNVVYTLATVYEKAGHHQKATGFLAEALRSYKMKQNKAGSVKVYHALARLKSSKAAELDSMAERSAAIECYKEALQIRRQIMSLDDIELASILYEYSILLCMHSDYETALPLLEEALRIQKSKNGLKDERVANILLKMAEIHVQQEKYDMSLVCLEQVLLIQSSLRDCCEIDLGSCYYLLGTTYLSRGEDFQKAINSYLECLEARKLKYGTNSLECAVVYNDLGKAYGKVQNFEKAIESLVCALRIRKSELGNNSLDYGHSVFNLSVIHLAQSKHEQALNCLSEAIRVFKLFPDYMGKKTAKLLEQKGDTLCELKDYNTAVSEFQKCIQLIELGENGDGTSYESTHMDDEQVARLNCKMGHAYAKLGAYEDAFDTYREAINIFSDTLGKDALHVGEVMYDVGHLIVNEGGDDTIEKSLECFNEVIRIFGLHGKSQDIRVADALFQKSTLLVDCSEYEEASSILDEAIIAYKELLGGDAVELGKTMLLCGRLHDAQGRNDESMTAFDEALRIFRISLGEDDMNLSIALQNVGIIHARKLEYAKAIEKCKAALKIRVIHGDQDQDVADAVFNIANIYSDWGKEEEAYKYFQQAFKLYTHLLGDKHISVAKCQQKLGVLHWNRTDIDRSLKSFMDALRVCEQENEDDVAIFLASIHKGMGDCYYNKGNFDQALENFAKCLRIQKRQLGDECIEMAEPCNSIGLIYQKKEKYEEAMTFHSKALLIYEKYHGVGSKECASSDFQIAKVLLASHKYKECREQLCNHLEIYCVGSDDNLEVADVHHPLALAQGKLGNHEESIASLKKALGIRTKLLGKTNIKVAETMLDLGKVLEDRGGSEEAIAVYDQAITIFHKIPESDFRATASAYSRLGALFHGKGNCEASLHSWKKALKIYSNNSGSDSIVVGEILHHIGEVYDQLGNFDKSTSCFSESVKILRSKADTNGLVGQALGYIGKYYARKHQYARAVELSTESLRLQKQYAEAGTIAESLVELGNILRVWGKADQAIQFFEEALRTYEEAFGIDALEVATCRHSLGILNKQLGHTEAALRYFGEALRVHRIKEGDKCLPVADNLFQIGQIYDYFGNKEKSLKCFEECLKIRQGILGDDHLDVLAAQRYINLVCKKMEA